MTETIKLLGSTKSKITEDKKEENILHSEITEIALVYCNIVNNDYQLDLRVLYSFFPNKSLVDLLDTSPKNLIFLKNFNSEFSYIEVWFTDQNSKLLETQAKRNITSVSN